MAFASWCIWRSALHGGCAAMQRVKARCRASNVSTSSTAAAAMESVAVHGSVLQLIGRGLAEVAFEVGDVDLGQLRVAPS